VIGVPVLSTALVTAGEILDLTLQARELATPGSTADLDDRVRFYDYKIEVLERIVAHGAIEVDPRLAEGALAHACAMRDEYVELMITGV